LYLVLTAPLKRIALIAIILLGISFSADFHAQTGGKKHERRGKKRGNFVLTQYKSHGNADKFARGNSGRRSRFSKLFKKKQSSWVYKSAGSKRSAYKANKYLLTRVRTTSKVENSDFLEHQNSIRSKSRVKGNTAFRSRKYKNR
jgi:hypothetical protein